MLTPLFLRGWVASSLVTYNVNALLSATDKASAVFKKVGGATNKLKNSFSKLGGVGQVAGGMLVAGLVQKGLGAVTGFVSGSVEKLADFETAMANVSTLLEDGEDALSIYGDELKAMAEELPVQGVNDLANAMYQVVSAGIPASKATEFLAIAAKAAKAGVTDTFTAVDGLTTILNAYGLETTEATRISDIFFGAVDAGKTTFPELSAAMSQVIPTASAMNVRFEEIAAGMATMTAGGATTAESATALNSVMIAMLKPSTDMEKAFQQLGFESGQAMLASLGLKGSMDALAVIIDSGAASATDLFPRVEALKAVFPLTGAQAEKFATNLDSITNSSGAAEAAFKIQADTYNSKMQTFQNTMDNLQMVMGEALAPAILEITTMLTENKETIKLVMEAIGLLIKYGIRFVIDSMKGWVKIGNDLFPLLAMLGEKIIHIIDFALLPMQLIFHALSGNWEAFGDTFKRVYDHTIGPIIETFKGALDAIGGVFEGLYKTVVGGSVWTDMLKEMEGQAKDRLPKIERRFEGLSDNIAGGIGGIKTGGRGSVNISGPLVVIEGNASEEDVNLAVNTVMTQLKTVIVENTSAGASVVTSRIRSG